jgi:hypothetical protein
VEASPVGALGSFNTEIGVDQEHVVELGLQG